MRKQDRQRIIKKMIQDNAIYRQEDFVSLLSAKGVEVTQATISRDVKRDAADQSTDARWVVSV